MMRYAGSKALRAPDIVAAIPDDVEHYVEPFCGSFCVFQRVIRHRPHLQSYLLNDIDADLIAWIKMARGDHTTHGDFIERLEECRSRLLPENEHEQEIRDEFAQSKDRWLFDGDPFSWYFLRLYALGQYVMRDRLNIASFEPRYFGHGIAPETIEKAVDLRSHLQQTTVERMDGIELLRDLDDTHFCYIDPPYLCADTRSDLYPYEMTEDQHVALAEVLKGAKFRFLLSMGDCPQTRDIYLRDKSFRSPYRNVGGFQVRQLGYTCTGRKTWRGAVPKTMEWLISNYDRPSEYPDGRSQLSMACPAPRPSQAAEYFLQVAQENKSLGIRTMLSTIEDSLGPKKLVQTFNLPLDGTCRAKGPDGTTIATAVCYSVCYARRMLGGRPGVRPCVDKNFHIVARDDFAELMTGAIHHASVAHFRLHAIGDFFSVPYINAWLQVIRDCPDVTFWCYTRAWRRPKFIDALTSLASEPNMSLLLSADRESGWPPEIPNTRVAWLADNDDEPPPKPGQVVFRATKERKKVPLTVLGETPVCLLENGRSKGPDNCLSCCMCMFKEREATGVEAA